MTRLFPLIFIILWASAFVTSKAIVDDSSPFAALSFRFGLVSLGFFIFCIFTNSKIILSFNDFIKASIIGICFHGLYLGGVFYAISENLSVGITAIIVSLQPILTAIFAGPFLKEVVTWKQWVGIMLGFFGTLLVIGMDIGESIPIIGLIASLIGLTAITSGTLLQRKIGGNIPLATSNLYQAFSAFIFLLMITFLFEKSFINFSLNFILSMSWQVIFVSFGAFTILQYLINTGTASRTATLFFLVPPVSVVMAWLFLNEKMTILDISGLIIATLGVYIATRR
jgi:drug/metabolite transporter (DMT)-like permease|tara:strand:+ start:109 stop:957 length:849 start_codon:yes stop_codon:yes gene_type:complete